MNKPDSTKPAARMYYIDNLRIYLTILVILHHNAIAYSGAGPWRILDPGVDEISSLLFMIFTILNQSYFMSAFFLLAGYFTPRSVESKGVKVFLIKRMTRIVIPVVVYTTLLVNINGYILDRFVTNTPFRIRIGYDVGHLWFLLALLAFSLIYVLFKVIQDQAGEKIRSRIFWDRFPPDKALLTSIILLGFAAFAVRLISPVGDWHLGIQPGHFVHYAFSFFVGILAYRGKWFDRLSGAQARRWGAAAFFTFLSLFPVIILGGALAGGENLAKFEGGLHWQALAYSLWESAMLVGVVIFLLYLFRERLNKTGRFGRFLAQNTFTVYIIHQTVLYFLQALGLRLDLPAALKFIIVSVIAVPLCFFLSELIRKIPLSKRVLG